MQPRPVHYAFAHQWVRDSFLGNSPVFTVNLLLGKTAFLRRLWARTAKGIGGAEDAGIPPEELAFESRPRPDGGKLLLITMPRPEAVTEAHFLALLVPPTDDSAPPRYFLLERGEVPDEGLTRTVLCEWYRAGQGFVHRNFGTGPEPDLEAFVTELENVLAGRPSEEQFRRLRAFLGEDL